MAALALALFGAGCADEPTDGSDVYSHIDDAEEATVAEANEGAEALGIAGQPEIREATCKQSLGQPDPSRIERLVTVREAVDTEVDLGAARDYFVSRGFEVATEDAEAIFLRSGDRRAGIQTGASDSDGVRNVWIEVTTGCFPVEK